MKDELISTSICYPPQACVKIKRYSPEMVGGKSEPVFYGRVTFEHDTLSLTLCLGLKIFSSLGHTPL